MIYGTNTHRYRIHLLTLLLKKINQKDNTYPNFLNIYFIISQRSWLCKFVCLLYNVCDIKCWGLVFELPKIRILVFINWHYHLKLGG